MGRCSAGWAIAEGGGVELGRALNAGRADRELGWVACGLAVGLLLGLGFAGFLFLFLLYFLFLKLTNTFEFKFKFEFKPHSLN